jgi:drug/metabolite transporter (DMT)-like permease
MRRAPSTLSIWIGLVTLYFVWGSTYLGIRIAVETIPPFLMGFMRFVAAGSVLAGVIAILNRSTLRRPSVREAVDVSVVGGMLLVGGMGAVAWAEQTVPSGVAALLIALMPMWLAIFSRLFYGDRLPVSAVAGIGIGLLGVAILAWPTGGVGQLDPAGLVALIASPIFWSLGTLYAARRAVLPAPALFATGLEMIAGGVLLLVAAAITGELSGFSLTQVSAASWASLGYLFVVGSLLGFTVFGWLVQVAPLPRLSTYAYVNPVVAVMLGWLIAGEPLTPRTIVAAVVIVVAVAMIVTARGRAADRTNVVEELPAVADGERVADTAVTAVGEGVPAMTVLGSRGEPDAAPLTTAGTVPTPETADPAFARADA